MAKKKHKSQNQPQPTKPQKGNINSLAFIKEALTMIGGLAGSILAVYGLVKTFKDDAEGFSWLIPVGIVIWLLILWRLFQVRKTTAYSLLIISILLGVVGWIGWQSQVKAAEKKVMVLVAQFDGPEEKYGLRDQIMEDLRQATKGYNDTVIIDGKEVVTAGQGNEYASELGKKAKADLVIWAWYRPTENPNITIHIENLSPNDISTLQESETFEPQATLADLESFEIQKRLGSDTSTLITFLTGVFHFKVGDNKTALERFKQTLIAADDSTYIRPTDLYFYLALVSANLKDFEASIQYSDKLIELDPNNAIALNNRGSVYGEIGRYESSLNDLNRAIELGPENAEYYINRANTWAKMGQFDSALDDFQKGLDLPLDQSITKDDRDAQIYFYRGLTYSAMKQDQLAIDDFSRSIELVSDYAATYLNRASVYADTGQNDEALKDFSKAIELDPTSSTAYLNRGLFYASPLNQYELALKDFNEAIELDASSSIAYGSRGNVFFLLKQSSQAIDDYNRAIQLNPNYVLAYSNRGAVYVTLDQFDRALADYTKAVQLDPSYASAFQNRGLLYQKLSKFDEAQADFKKYEELTGKKP